MHSLYKGCALLSIFFCTSFLFSQSIPDESDDICFSAEELADITEILTVPQSEETFSPLESAVYDNNIGQEIISAEPEEFTEATPKEVAATETEEQILAFNKIETNETEINNNTDSSEFSENSTLEVQAEIAESEIIFSEPEEETETEESIPYITLCLPGADRDETCRFRQKYLKPEWAKMLNSYLENGLEYRLYVRNALAQADMPDILEYLPVVESEYNPKAKSRSGALGLWQFMENSVKPFLELNDFVDQRLDPWASTEAAIKKLKDNFNMFGDWTLAIAAYNCGAGALKKALAKSEEKNFWALAEQKLIPQQTADYIPKLIAIADLALNAEYYGIELNLHEEDFSDLYQREPEEEFSNYDFITVNKAYSLTQLSSELKMSNALIKKLNPSYILDMTHPFKESILRLPKGMAKSAEQALERITPIDYPFKYTVVSGDSLWSISRKYNVTVKAICEINNIDEKAILKIGKVLYIPKK